MVPDWIAVPPHRTRSRGDGEPPTIQLPPALSALGRCSEADPDSGRGGGGRGREDKGGERGVYLGGENQLGGGSIETETRMSRITSIVLAAAPVCVCVFYALKR